MTEAGTDDPAHDGTVYGDAIGEDDGQRNRIRQAKGDDATLPVVPPRIVELDIGRGKHLCRELKVESALDEVPITLRGIPVERHTCNLRLYIHKGKSAGPYNENAFCCTTASRARSRSATVGPSLSSNAC